MADTSTWIDVFNMAYGVMASHPIVISTLTATTALSLRGVVPRAGPARAVSLACRSLFFYAPTRTSVRTAEVARLRNAVKFCSEQEYIVVYGAKGCGECDLWVDTAPSSVRCPHDTLQCRQVDADSNGIKAPPRGCRSAS